MLSPSWNKTMPTKLTKEQRMVFEARMEELWNARQEELKRAQAGVANLPEMLRERIITIKGYLDGIEGSLRGILEGRRGPANIDGCGSSSGNDDDHNGSNKDDNVVRDVVDALRGLKWLPPDVNMAQDFHTLGGWSPLVTLLGHNKRPHLVGEDKVDAVVLFNEIRSLMAMAVDTVVGNMGELRLWVLEGVSLPPVDAAAPALQPHFMLLVLLLSFQGKLALRLGGTGGETTTMAVDPPPSDAWYKTCGTYRLHTIYALGSLLWGNPPGQAYFALNYGLETLVPVALSALSSTSLGRAVSSGGCRRAMILD
jgi:nucleotide exchange factor SIL1